MLAIMPSEALASRIREVRVDFASKYRCEAALKPPVHITLVPPFHAPEDRETEIINRYDQGFSGIRSFPVVLDGFGIFKRKQVVFIKLVDDESLTEMHRIAGRIFHDLFPEDPLDDRPYHPHITIGYRDIPKDLFKIAAAEYLPMPFAAEFTVDRFFLWKHDGKAWQVNHEFKATAL
jgi:2'-5' RNA ligase